MIRSSLWFIRIIKICNHPLEISKNLEFLRKSLIISSFKMVPKGRFELPTKGL